MEKYDKYKKSGISWIGEIPEHWKLCKAKYMFKKNKRPVRSEDDVITCFRDGEVTLRKNRRTTGFTESITEIGYQGIRKGDLVIHQMDAFAGAIGVSDSDGKGTSVYHCCTPVGEYDTTFYAYFVRTMAKSGYIQSLYRGIRERSSDFNFTTFGNQVLVIPPLSEQHAIVSFLDRKTADIDKFIADKEHMFELYKEGIDSLIFCQYRNERRKIYSWDTAFPGNWNLVSGKLLFEELKIKGREQDRFLAVTQDNGLIYKDTGEVNFVTAEKKETQKLVCPGQYVISLRSFEGGIEYSDKRGLISPAYVVLKLRDEYNTEELRAYYRFLLKSKPFVQRLNRISDSMRDGKSIKYSDIKYFHFPIPTPERLKVIYTLIQKFDAAKNIFQKEKDLLIEYKQRLISDVVTGQIKVC